MVLTEFSQKKYQIIYSDPPWDQKKGGVRKCRPNQHKDLDYKTLSMPEIEQIHRNIFEKTTEQKHNVFMWTIDKYLFDTEAMMKRLGYTLHARMIWDKTNGVSPAFTVRFSHEYLLWFYKKGNILMPVQEMRGKCTTVLREVATKHSKKPAVAYEMLEKMFPDKHKLELFAREQRAGWDAWGDEITAQEQEEE